MSHRRNLAGNDSGCLPAHILTDIENDVILINGVFLCKKGQGDDDGWNTSGIRNGQLRS
jgi:hypothetical protein